MKNNKKNKKKFKNEKKYIKIRFRKEAVFMDKGKGKDLKAKSGGFIKEFKEFISHGNVMDLAIGVIIGGAFGKIVSSLVDNILMPLIGVILGGLDFSELAIKVGEANIKYGIFIQNVIDFLIVALCLFVMMKALNKFKKKEEPKEEAPADSPEVATLKEIRDLLKKKK